MRKLRTYFPAIGLALAVLLQACGAPPKLVDHEGKTARLVRLGKTINSSADDFAPQLTPTADALIFTSNRELPQFDDEIDRLFISQRMEDGLTKAKYDPVNKDPDIKVGAVSYDPVNSEVFFVQCYMPDGYGDCDLYIADVVDGEWKNVRNAGPVLNSIEWDAHPSISRDGTTLYFATERDGQSEIYYATRKGGGGWSNPVNNGPPINTGGDEKSPFISNDGEKLYFASDDHPGYGQLDMFVSEKRGRQWAPPLNMGVPYNSREDDVFFTTTSTGDTTFLASNRDGGEGGFDIYQIIRSSKFESDTPDEKEPPKPPAEKKPLIVRYAVLNGFTYEPIHAYLSLDTEGQEEIEIQTIGEAKAQTQILAGKEYATTVSAPGFETQVEEFSYPPEAHGIKDRRILLIPVDEEERKIYSFVVEFDFDLFNIRPEERKHLDSVVALLKEFPDSKVVASGHTDAKGTVNYNIRLGYNRAKSVSKYVERYLKQAGVRIKNEMEIRTYGESMPVDTNETDEGRQRNRRVEIAIVRLK